MNLSKKNKVFFVALCISTLLTLMWMFTMFSISSGQSPIYEIIELTMIIVFSFSASALIYNAHSFGYKHIIGKSLYFLSGGLISFIISHLVWIYYVFLSDSFIPFPSLIDVFYILMAPFLITGIWYLLAIYNTKRSLLFWMKSILLFILIMILFFIVAGFPNISTPQTNGQQFFNIIYPLVNVAYISTIIISLWIIRRRFYKGLGMIILALALIVISDIITSIEISKGIWIEGGVPDQLMIIASFLIGVGGIISANHFKNQNILK